MLKRWPTVAWIVAVMINVSFSEDTSKQQCLKLIDRELFSSAIVECSTAICTD